MEDYLEKLEEIERGILLSSSFCIKSIFTNCQKLIDNNKEIEKLKRIKILPIPFLQRIMCLIPSSCTIDEKIVDISLSNKKQSDENTDIYESRIKDLEESVLIKVLKDDNYISSLHEIFVGIYAVNELRKNCLNFIYTYGFINCNKPNQKNCAKDYNEILIVSEFVKDNIRLKEKITKLNKKKFSKIFFQILCSLRSLNEKFGFVHLDLHINNILLQKLEDPIEIIYSSDLNPQMTYKHLIDKDDYLVRIIDYDFCKIIVDETQLCSKIPQFPEFKTFNLFSDIYKFLCNYLFNKGLKDTQDFIIEILTMLFSNLIQKSEKLIKKDGMEDVKLKQIWLYLECLNINMFASIYNNSITSFKQKYKYLSNNRIIEEIYFKFYVKFIEVTIEQQSKERLIKNLNFFLPPTFKVFFDWLEKMGNVEKEFIGDIKKIFLSSFQEGWNMILRIYPNYNEILEILSLKKK